MSPLNDSFARPAWPAHAAHPDPAMNLYLAFRRALTVDWPGIDPAGIRVEIIEGSAFDGPTLTAWCRAIIGGIGIEHAFGAIPSRWAWSRGWCEAKAQCHGEQIRRRTQAARALVLDQQTIRATDWDRVLWGYGA